MMMVGWMRLFNPVKSKRAFSTSLFLPGFSCTRRQENGLAQVKWPVLVIINVVFLTNVPSLRIILVFFFVFFYRLCVSAVQPWERPPQARLSTSFPMTSTSLMMYVKIKVFTKGGEQTGCCLLQGRGSRNVLKLYSSLFLFISYKSFSRIW